MKMTIKIVPGGQTGVDRRTLEAPGFVKAIIDGKWVDVI